jgi:hypothetical protein
MACFCSGVRIERIQGACLDAACPSVRSIGNLPGTLVNSYIRNRKEKVVKIFKISWFENHRSWKIPTTPPHFFLTVSNTLKQYKATDQITYSAPNKAGSYILTILSLIGYFVVIKWTSEHETIGKYPPYSAE